LLPAAKNFEFEIERRRQKARAGIRLSLQITNSKKLERELERATGPAIRVCSRLPGDARFIRYAHRPGTK
jgi:hypothetical protein